MRFRFVLCSTGALACLVGIFALSSPLDAQEARPPLLERALEIELALSALPAPVRASARVLALERGGYVPARDGDNGFTCLVRRSGAVPGHFDGAVLPICYDAEGSRSLLPAVLEEVRMLESGRTFAEVTAAIARGWEDGLYSLPGPGVAYMLSPVFCLRGRCGGYVPHTMFYAPYATNATTGANDDLFDHVPSLQAPGSPAAMLVVPVGVEERRAILEQGASLMERAAAVLSPRESPPGTPPRP